MLASINDVHCPNILIVDDTPANLQLLSDILRERGCKVRPVPSGKLALHAAISQPPDLILLDINMPEMNGFEVCKLLKSDDQLRDIPVIFISARNEVLDKVQAFSLGGADYVTKPFEVEELLARVATHVRLHDLQREVRDYNLNLQRMVREQVREISDAQLAILSALATLAEYRDEETGGHIMRVQYYSITLARHLESRGIFGSVIDAEFTETIFHASVLHDIGKVAIPDSILCKNGPLTEGEFRMIRKHSQKGADALTAVYRKYPNALLKMGIEIARSHHERWDGSGYPDGLAGEAIPLAARIVALADNYDALRTARPYKPAYDAATTYEILTAGNDRVLPQYFDPRILAAFTELAAEFDAIYKDFP
jgi:putative two-component system response regulator